MSYSSETDSMYIDLLSNETAESKEVSRGVLDYDAQGNRVGIDIDNASQKMELQELILSSLPVSKQ
jgi:uncharacterized protein YuzE